MSTFTKAYLEDEEGNVVVPIVAVETDEITDESVTLEKINPAATDDSPTSASEKLLKSKGGYSILSKVVKEMANSGTSSYPTFNTSTAYAKDAIVVKDDELYKFTVAHSAGAWNSSQVTRVSIKDILQAQITSNAKNIGYYTCDIAGATAAKTVAATGYLLQVGGAIRIKMSHKNTAANPTLNINSQGAKPLFYDGVRASVENTWEDNEILDVFYDGTNYQANNVAGGGTFADGYKVKEITISDYLKKGDYDASTAVGLADNLRGNVYADEQFAVRMTGGEANEVGGIGVVQQLKGAGAAISQLFP